MDEIELMKKVGKHQNVLSFFGCWTTTKPILLMIEYIAHGDLLHWLRHKRSQVLKKLPTDNVCLCLVRGTHGNVVNNERKRKVRAGSWFAF